MPNSCVSPWSCVHPRRSPVSWTVLRHCRLPREQGGAVCRQTLLELCQSLAVKRLAERWLMRCLWLLLYSLVSSCLLCSAARRCCVGNATYWSIPRSHWTSSTDMYTILRGWIKYLTYRLELLMCSCGYCLHCSCATATNLACYPFIWVCVLCLVSLCG